MRIAKKERGLVEASIFFVGNQYSCVEELPLLSLDGFGSVREGLALSGFLVPDGWRELF